MPSSIWAPIAAPRSAAGAEAAIVAKHAAAHRDGAVDIGAGEPGVDADFLNTPAEFAPQEKAVGVVSQSGRTPHGLLVSRGGGQWGVDLRDGSHKDGMLIETAWS